MLPIMIIWLSVAHCLLVNLKPNLNWVCDGCDEYDSRIVFSMINHVLQNDIENNFLLLDSSWKKLVLRHTSKINVSVVNCEDLSTYIGFEPTDNDLLETYNIVISNITKNCMSDHNSLQSINIIDQFLVNNPCWVPIHDPDLFYHGDNNTDTSTWNKPPGHIATDRLLMLELLKHTSIFIHLPTLHFHDTCLLYKSITKKQFPSVCPSKLFMHCIGNIGWVSIFENFLYHLAHSLEKYQDSVLVVPKSYDFRSRRRRIKLLNGKIIRARGGWYWLNPPRCQPYMDDHDPWSCNFLPITNCTFHLIGTEVPPCPVENLKFRVRLNWNTPKSYLASINITDESRQRYHDAPFHDELAWSVTRLAAFLQRPNLQMRFLIKKSLQQHTVSVLLNNNNNNDNGKDKSIHTNFVRNEINMNHHYNMNHHNNHYINQDKLPRANKINNLNRPCIALHVRHGDMIYDWRAKLNLDRSFDFHVQQVRNLSKDLSIDTIFLATDNATLVQIASKTYPEYQWTTQRRPINDRNPLFEVNNENDIQLELSHILADFMLASRCRGIVGYFDSGFTRFLFLSMCAHNPEGGCPPSIDLSNLHSDPTEMSFI